MFIASQFTKAAAAFATVGGLAVLATTAPAMADDQEIGAKEYQYSCQVCHGVDGTGNGDMVETLTVQPANLTEITKNNDGVFPLLEVFQVIDGRTMIKGHGTNDMPIWGARYSEEIGDDYGPYGAEQAIRARILELVFYIQTLQK